MTYDDIANGRRYRHPDGYWYVFVPPLKRDEWPVREHIAIAAIALGRPLPRGAVVHHVDENTGNNARRNLVLCPDAQYHKDLHKRMRVRAAGGDPWRDWICSTCRAVKPLTEFYRQHGQPVRECKPCLKIRVRNWKRKRRHAASLVRRLEIYAP